MMHKSPKHNPSKDYRGNLFTSLYNKKDDEAIPELDAYEEESNFNVKSHLSGSVKSPDEHEIDNSHIGSSKHINI